MATQIAYYFEHAGILTAAAHYCALAGEKASQRFANAEAFGQFRRGIELLNSGACLEGARCERAASAGRSCVACDGSQGFESDEVAAVLSRAIELNQRLGDSPPYWRYIGWFTEGFNTPDLIDARQLLHMCNLIE